MTGTIYIRACECGCTDVTHEEHFFDEAIYDTKAVRNRDGSFTKTGKRHHGLTVTGQLLSQRWYCKGCGALLQEKRFGERRDHD